MKKEIAFLGSGAVISAILGLPEDFDEQGKYPAVAINHGYSGNKEEYNGLAAVLNKHGYITLQFDSRGCGSTEAVKGRMMCSTEWLEDADSAVTYITGLEYADSGRIGYTGCSMGGAVTVYMAANDARIKCAAAMAPFSDGLKLLKECWTERKGINEWNGFLQEIENDNKRLAEKNSSRYVSVPYALCMTPEDEKEFNTARDMDSKLVRDIPLESVRDSFLKFRPVEFCSRINIPILFIHGDEDCIVPKKHSEIMFHVTGSKKELAVISGAPHPLPLCEQRAEVFGHIIRWFDHNL